LIRLLPDFVILTLIPMGEESPYGKATEEAFRATGKAIDAARECGKWLARLVKRPLREAVGMLEDHLRVVRWERQQRLIERVNKFLQDRGLLGATRPVPLKIALPIIQQGCLEEDDDLQDLWAQLLVNAADAASDTEVRSSFVNILKDLTALDAVNLAKIYSFAYENVKGSGVWTGELPEAISLDGKPGVVMRPSVAVSLDNLLRLRLVDNAAAMAGGGPLYTVFQTELGRAFFRACSNRKSVMSGESDNEGRA
jgi:hypothetical protein